MRIEVEECARRISHMVSPSLAHSRSCFQMSGAVWSVLLCRHIAEENCTSLTNKAIGSACPLGDHYFLFMLCSDSDCLLLGLRGRCDATKQELTLTQATCTSCSLSRQQWLNFEHFLLLTPWRVDVGPEITLFLLPRNWRELSKYHHNFRSLICRVVERASSLRRNADSLQSHLEIGPIHESCAHRWVVMSCESRIIEMLTVI